MEALWALCFCLITVQSVTGHLRDERWNQIRHDAKEKHLSAKEKSLQNVIRFFQSLVPSKLNPNAKEVQMETNEVEYVIKISQQQNISNPQKTEGGTKNETNPETVVVIVNATNADQASKKGDTLNLTADNNASQNLVKINNMTNNDRANATSNDQPHISNYTVDQRIIGKIVEWANYTLIDLVFGNVTNSDSNNAQNQNNTGTNLNHTLSDGPTNTDLNNTLSDYSTNTNRNLTLSDDPTNMAANANQTLQDAPNQNNTSTNLNRTLSDGPTNKDLNNTLSDYSTNANRTNLTANDSPSANDSSKMAANLTLDFPNRNTTFEDGTNVANQQNVTNLYADMGNITNSGTQNDVPSNVTANNAPSKILDNLALNLTNIAADMGNAINQTANDKFARSLLYGAETSHRNHSANARRRF